jgi:proline racemase
VLPVQLFNGGWRLLRRQSALSPAAGCVATVLLETGIIPMQEPETKLVLEPIIGSTFCCHIEAEATVGGHLAVTPVISGQAWITGTHQHMLDPSDPFPSGYRLSDTWPTPRQAETRIPN